MVFFFLLIILLSFCTFLFSNLFQRFVFYWWVCQWKKCKYVCIVCLPVYLCLHNIYMCVCILCKTNQKQFYFLSTQIAYIIVDLCLNLNRVRSIFSTILFLVPPCFLHSKDDRHFCVSFHFISQRIVTGQVDTAKKECWMKKKLSLVTNSLQHEPTIFVSYWIQFSFRNLVPSFQQVNSVRPNIFQPYCLWQQKYFRFP